MSGRGIRDVGVADDGSVWVSLRNAVVRVTTG